MKVTNATTAKAFLSGLHERGLLYHPEESAAGSLWSHDLGADELAGIDANMRACFDHLPDPCETALDILNA